MQRYIAAAVFVLVFGLMYTFVLQPIIFYIFGFNSSSSNVNKDDSYLSSMESRSRLLKAQPHESNQNTSKRGSFLLFALPFYGLGVLVYFTYTLIKLFTNRKEIKDTKKEQLLKDYYRNFRYNTDKGKFQMDSDSSDDDHKNLCRRLQSGGNTGGKFDWSAAYTENGNSGTVPDIYRSVTGLPRDLEYLLKKVDESDLDDAELNLLQNRLGQMEDEMTRILRAVSTSPTSCPPENSVEQQYHNLRPQTNLHNQHPQLPKGNLIATQNEDEEDEEALFSAAEDV